MVLALICFRLGGKDAVTLARELEPQFEAVNLLNLPNYHIYLKLMIDGAPSGAFSARTLPAQRLSTKVLQESGY